MGEGAGDYQLLLHPRAGVTDRAGPPDVTALNAAIARAHSEGSYSAYLAAFNALSSLGEAATQDVFRIGILRNFTVEPLLPVIAVELARSGLRAATYVGDFDAIAADALDTNGGLARFDPQAIIIALWLGGLSPRLAERFPSMSVDEVTSESTRVLDDVREMLQGIRRFSDAPILLNNVPLPHRLAFGILDAQRDHSQTEAILSLNRGLRGIAREVGNVFVVDYMTVFASVGTAVGFDHRNWLHRRSPIGRGALVAIAHEYAKHLRALRGRVRKCVVVDCDDTLWGGVIGEDGIDGIQLGEGHPGASHTALQLELLNLHDRGVLIALCSKNNEADVLNVMRSHPGMLLKDAHIAAHRINWDDKASNVCAIASELNIGLDSIVFVDDSAFECGLVRERLPEVAVIELDAAAGDLGSQLMRDGYFDSLVSSKEDRLRTAHFRAEVVRRDLQGSASSLEEYLERLEMVAEIGVAHDEEIPRVAQLTQKTNQFNLTTRRYTESDIRRFVGSASTDVLYLRLRDKIADLGIVGVAIMHTADGVAEIDSLLMSCRALGRGVEWVMLDELRRRAEERGCSAVRGVYVPTAKNAQVAGLYPSAGFSAEAESGSSRSFIADVAALPRAPKAISVVRPQAPRAEAS